MTSSWIILVDPKSRSWCPLRNSLTDDRHTEKRPCDEGGRDWSDGATKTTDSHQKVTLREMPC
jgi:hypothetical protein